MACDYDESTDISQGFQLLLLSRNEIVWPKSFISVAIDVVVIVGGWE